MAETTLTVQHEAGLHARPLAQFVKLARQYDATVEVTNLTREKGPANGTSPLKLMLLAVLQGHEITISATGPQANEAVAALQALVERNFEEGSEPEA
ncbi:MAG: HPr family phosphocarrier protein [Ardenticatenaceae bacterium]|nr:HPr family phosphocarrier protein [Anaerolineales bacterium]MCB8940960.1 HPr family phosphocarrier protein [Ardenticatenaceae bacterium]MCB8972299.1 HPr family phosphocarrier protein [Ardenticatenaceae bacterium]